MIRRMLFRLFNIGIIIFIVGLFALNSETNQRFIVQQIFNQVKRDTGVTLSYEAFSGTLLSGWSFIGLRGQRDDAPLFTIKHTTLKLDILELLLLRASFDKAAAETIILHPSLYLPHLPSLMATHLRPTTDGENAQHLTINHITLPQCDASLGGFLWAMVKASWQNSPTGPKPLEALSINSEGLIQGISLDDINSLFLLPHPISGEIHLTGTFQKAKAQTTFSVTVTTETVNIGNLLLEPSHITVVQQKRHWALGLHIDLAKQSPLSVDIRLPRQATALTRFTTQLGLIKPPSIKIKADRVDLNQFNAFLPSTWRIKGVVQGDFAWNTKDKRQGQGAVSISNLLIAHSGAHPFTIHDTTVSLAPTEKTTTLDLSLSGKIDEGHFNGKGLFDLSSLDDLDLAFNLSTRDLALTPRSDLTLKPDIDLTWQWRKNQLLTTGTITLKQGLWKPPLNFLQTRTLAEDPTIIITSDDDKRTTTPQKTNTPGALTHLYEWTQSRATMDITLTVPGNVWIKHTHAASELHGKIRIKKTPVTTLNIDGAIHLDRGWVNYKGKQFTITQGRFTVVGLEAKAIVLHVDATHDIQNVTITIHIRGNANAPRISLQSVPQHTDAEIASLLLLGKLPQELSQGEQVQLKTQVLNYTSGLVTQELKSELRNHVGMQSDFEIDFNQLDLSNQSIGGAIGIGKKISKDIYIAIYKQLDKSDGDRISVEYKVRPQVKVRTGVSTRRRANIDLIWTKDY